MFKNLVAFRIQPSWEADFSSLESQLEAMAFTPCGPSQEQSIGWIPPRGEAHGALAEAIDGHWILRLCVEKKILPGAVVKRKLDERCAKIERETGRKPGKKEKRDLKDEVRMELLPTAFTKVDSISVWIDPKARLALVDGSSVAKADNVVSALVNSIEGMGLTLLNTQSSPMSMMAHWLASGEAPSNFTIDRQCELRSSDGTKATVKYANHSLEIEEIKQHIAGGKMPMSLAMTWNDRVSFVLTDALVVKKIGFLDTVFEDKSQDGENGFDADYAILTGELKSLLPDLIDALGGEVVVD